MKKHTRYIRNKMETKILVIKILKLIEEDEKNCLARICIQDCYELDKQIKFTVKTKRANNDWMKLI